MKHTSAESSKSYPCPCDTFGAVTLLAPILVLGDNMVAAGFVTTADVLLPLMVLLTKAAMGDSIIPDLSVAMGLKMAAPNKATDAPKKPYTW